MNSRYYLLSIITFVWQSCQPTSSHNSYLDQELPGITPKLFASSIVNTDDIEINAVFNASFDELFFTRIIDGSFVIHHSELMDGNWTAPQPIQMYADQEAGSVAIDPSITQDGNTMYFLGINPEDRSNNSYPDIYRSQKIEGQWQIASKVEYPISTEEYAESYPVVVADGSLYFESDRPGGFGKRDIYRAQYLGDGKFDTPVNIGPEVNSEETARSTYVSPDESFLIIANTSTEEKGFDVSFKVQDKWQALASVNFEEPLNQEWVYCCPYMSPDGEYFFFSRRYSDPPKSGWKGVTKGEVYWVNADVIFDLKRK
ncbi:hypothetical protein FNH22_06455 [Fulvivirga sp. M361]|uniref:PD40 domain-containing protein n=1 Tax=Fulvivirga sp. M361 TaxID=2594266 RepID=UPI00117AE417|nr:PD40 domain-containing protein [Fulvivirga sp. M361]TRX60681.1 hypothetical protein FNH22_06455 [Fulvivirga sp. M361]